MLSAGWLFHTCSSQFSRVHVWSCSWPSCVWLRLILMCHPRVFLICLHFLVVSSLSKMPNPELLLPSIINRALILSPLLIAACWGVLLIAANYQTSGTFLWFSFVRLNFSCSGLRYNCCNDVWNWERVSVSENKCIFHHCVCFSSCICNQLKWPIVVNEHHAGKKRSTSFFGAQGGEGEDEMVNSC